MTLKWSIPDLLEHQRNGLTIDTTVSIEDLKDRDEEIRGTSPVHVTGYADFNRNTVTFFLTITGKLILPDSLTLEDVDYPFHISTQELFRLRATPLPEDIDEDIEVHDVEDQTIDLMPYIKEAILVEKPIRFVSEEGKDRPSPSGNGWQLVTESERSGQMDPRFEKLKDLFNE
jgi:uncharacterized protein